MSLATASASFIGFYMYRRMSSSSLVTNNTLTDEGDKAVGCVRNGLMLPAANQQYLHLSFGMEKMIIGSLTGMTGCNNFINMNAL
ncbi:MAG: hypothetical protein WAK17_19600 [Candidatus Nitrosopolaris sp.]